MFNFRFSKTKCHLHFKLSNKKYTLKILGESIPINYLHFKKLEQPVSITTSLVVVRRRDIFFRIKSAVL